MPLTAKLSQKFYQKFGDDIANELVAWFNEVDATYHADLRELNELNFSRFDAKLEQRLAEQDARWERRLAEFALRRDMEAGFAKLADLRTEICSAETRIIRWMFAFWLTTTTAWIGAMVALLRL
ncbi:MAG: hypothetical protein AABY85_07505 [Gemmatimonadota bacterium]